MFIGIAMMTSLIIHPMSKSWMHKCLKRNPWCQNYLLIMSKSLTREIIPVHLPMPNQPLFQFMWSMVMPFNIIVFNTFKKGLNWQKISYLHYPDTDQKRLFLRSGVRNFCENKYLRLITIRMLPNLSVFHELFKIITYFLFIRAKKGIPLVMKVPCNTGYILQNSNIIKYVLLINYYRGYN